MKRRRPAIIAFVLLAFLGIGWHNRRQLASMRSTRASLLAQAAAKGFRADGENPGSLSLPAKLPRLDRVAEAKQVSAGLIAFATEMKGLPYVQDADSLDEPVRKRIAAEMDRVTALDAGQLKILIADFQAASKDSGEYHDLIGFALHRLMKDHPVDALELMVKPPGLLELVHKDVMQADLLLSDAVTALSAQDPAKAVEWLVKNRDSMAPFERDTATDTVVRATASQDPRLAVEMIKEYGLNAATLLPAILPRATPEERSLSLELLRGWGPFKTVSPSGEDPFRATLKRLAFGSEGGPEDRRASFEDSAPWIDQAKLTPAELEIVADNLQNNIRSRDAGRWLEWLDRNLPPESVREWSGPAFRNWVRDDLQAAEAWLGAAPGSPAQESAVIAYARSVVHRNPQKAIQRALTLPDEKKRREVLQDIYRDWPRKDEDPAAQAAAAAFASEHGISTD